MKLSEIFTYNFTPGGLFKTPLHPLNAFLDITASCNNKCMFCYNSESYIQNNKNVDPEKLKKIVTLLGSTGTKEILYLGGEPFLYPHIIDILTTGKEYDIFQRAVSNGSYFKDKSFCDRLKNAGLSEVGISFHSSKKDIHDKLSGRSGAFEDAINGVEKCLEADIPVFIQYSPNQWNSEDDIVLFAQMIRERYGTLINMFDVNRLLPIGIGGNANHIIMNEEQWFRFLVTLSSVCDMDFEIRVELSPFCWIREMALQYGIPEAIVEKIYSFNRGCYMWIAQLPLDCNGNIKFCPAGEKVGPNILEVDWPDYWQSGILFQKFRNFTWNSKCIDFSKNKACEFFYQCLAGCKYTDTEFISEDSLTLGYREKGRSLIKVFPIVLNRSICH
jgi:MoaA/NifB/PqqE/SkfB family radical SAM enzyme